MCVCVGLSEKKESYLNGCTETQHELKNNQTSDGFIVDCCKEQVLHQILAEGMNSSLQFISDLKLNAEVLQNRIDAAVMFL